MPFLRIAKITYDHHPIEWDEQSGGTIGQMVDRHIQETIASGAMISEVTLGFETMEEQAKLASAYTAMPGGAVSAAWEPTKAKPAKRSY
jgi:hypothetical protein